MSNLHKAASAALEALEGVLDTYGEPLDLLSISGGTYEALQCRDAIAALRAALAEPDYASANQLGGPAVVFDAIARRLRSGEPYDEVLDDYGLQHASAEPVQDHFPDVTKMVPELVAWRITDGEGDWDYRTDLPEDWSIQWSARYGRRYEPLYSAPPQRKPLTDEEIDELSRTMVKGDRSVNWLCRAIERAHGIGGDA